MEKKIVVNFKNIVSELNEKNMKLCFIKKQRYIYLIDNQNNLYQMETFHVGSYLDKLIKDGTTVEFNHVDVSLSNNIGDWEKEIWGIPEVKIIMELTA